MQKPHTWAVLLAAGEGKRIGIAKQFFPYQGAPLWWHSVQTFAKSPYIQGVVVVFPSTNFDATNQSLQELLYKNPPGIPVYAVSGGFLRQDSVLCGLQAIPSPCSHVLIHDSARPFFTPSLLSRLLEPLYNNDAIAGIVPAMPVTDTIKRVELSEKILDDSVCSALSEKTPEKVVGKNAEKVPEKVPEKIADTLDRTTLRAVQTPQAFVYDLLKYAHENRESRDTKASKTNKDNRDNQGNKESMEYTDDAELMESFGHSIFTVYGEHKNIKITHTKDLTMLLDAPRYEPCTGFGYDVHKYGVDNGNSGSSESIENNGNNGNSGNKGSSRPLVLAGIQIPCDIKVVAHSDGDILFHALMDAMLSCMGKGDIGKLFPDTDPQFDNISSALLLDSVMELWHESALKLCHVDITIVCQKPRISPYTRQIQDSLIRQLNLDSTRVNVKATTEEGLGFTGHKLGMKVYAVVSAIRVV